MKYPSSVPKGYQEALDIFAEHPSVLVIKLEDYTCFRTEKEIQLLPLGKRELIVQEKTNA